MNIKNFIYDVPDFPTKGIVFKDITPICGNGQAFEYVTDQFVKYAKKKKADVILSPESRGFIFGCPVATALGIGFVPVRKPGKLPREVIKEEYALEYGTNVLAIHSDSLLKGQNVIIIDDLLATGGTVMATIKLAERLGANVVGIACVVELTDLNGRETLKGYDLFCLTEDTE